MPPGYVLVFNSTSGSSGLGNAHALARNMSASTVSLQSCSGMHCKASDSSPPCCASCQQHQPFHQCLCPFSRTLCRLHAAAGHIRITF